MSDNKICSLCSCEYTEYGNNPEPLSEGGEERCCNICNACYVVPARLLQVITGSNSAKFIRAMAKYSAIGRLSDFQTLKEGARKFDPSI